MTRKKKYKFVILIGQGEDMHIVCRRGFARAYSVSHWYIEDIIDRLKRGDLNCLSNCNPEPCINPSVMSDDRLKRFAENYGIYLTPEQTGAAYLAQTEGPLMCSSWMQYYFGLVGDHPPNTDSEIHLDQMPKEAVWQEYKFDMEMLGHKPLTLDVFRKIWRHVYPYVKMRKYKTTCGHCNLCSLLGEKRREFRDRAGREEVTNLFALHRMSTMNERRTYYDRRLEAELNKGMFLSTISDGMQQNHCFLPWYGNQKMPALHIKQHLQGVMMHGHNMTVYRTFANVGGGCNLAIQTWLLSLERHYYTHGKKLPPVLYHQIDGGPENANAEFLALCALLVACKLVKKVVLTRLPVGHTHEDIDGLFALIWRKLRDQYIITPSEFVGMIKHALKKKVKVWVVDLFALPDYVGIFKDCVDPALGRFAKQEWTVLQFTFEATPVSDRHPLGVEKTYKYYVQDEFVEIVEDQDGTSRCGLVPQVADNTSHPRPGEAPFNPLRKLPAGDFAPAPFIAGSRNLVEELSSKLYAKYEKDKPEIAREWGNWAADVAPLSDNAQDYITTSSGVVPDPDPAFAVEGLDYTVEGGGRLCPI